MNDTKFAKYHPAKPLEDVVHGLIYLYILTIPFQALWFRLIGLSIGIPEIVFIILVPLAIIHIMCSGQKLWIDRLDLFVFGWLATNILTGWHAGFDSVVITEIIKTAYLVVLYAILKWTITPEMITRIGEIIILSSLIAAITGILGFGLGYFGIDNTLSITRPFPYLIENVIQAKGFTPTPNMLASIIMIGVLFHLQKLSPNGKDYLILLTLLIGFFLTLSKTIVCLLIGTILIIYFNNKSRLSYTWQLTTRLSVAGLFITNLFGTHFIILEKDQNSELLKGDYIAGAALIKTNKYSIYPSQYWSLKRISCEAIKESFPWGLGQGKFNNFANELKKDDTYPTHVPYPDPHSTYFGTFAEIGLLGLIAFFGIIFYVVKYSRKMLNNHSAYQNVLASLPIIFIIIGIEAISTDVLNFRHYWILLILLEINFKTTNQLIQKA